MKDAENFQQIPTFVGTGGYFICKMELSKTVTPFFSPKRAAGEPNYETAVVPK